MKKMIPLVALLFCVSCGSNYSNGERIGIVTKLSEKGLLFKSWEGEMLIALPPDAAASGAQPEKFEFNVDPEAVSKVKSAALSGKRVRLIYRQWALAPPTIDNDHVVIDVQSVENKGDRK